MRPSLLPEWFHQASRIVGDDDIYGAALLARGVVALHGEGDEVASVASLVVGDGLAEPVIRTELFVELMEELVAEIDLDPPLLVPGDVVLVLVVEDGFELVARTVDGYECGVELRADPGWLTNLEEGETATEALMSRIIWTRFND